MFTPSRRRRVVSIARTRHLVEPRDAYRTLCGKSVELASRHQAYGDCPDCAPTRVYRWAPPAPELADDADDDASRAWLAASLDHQRALLQLDLLLERAVSVRAARAFGLWPC